MVKCRQAVNDSTLECKNCCKFCDKKNDCKFRCDDYDATEDCKHEIHEEVFTSELQVIQAEVPEALKAVCAITIQKKKLDEQEAEMKKQILDAMERNGIKSFETPDVKFVYVAPTTRTSIDSAKLKKQYPDIASECSKVSSVKSSVRISVK